MSFRFPSLRGGAADEAIQPGSPARGWAGLPRSRCSLAMTATDRRRLGWAITFFGLFLCLAQFYVQNAWAATVTGCPSSDFTSSGVNIFSSVYAGGAGQGSDLVATAASSNSVVAIFGGVLAFFQGTVETVMTQMYCGFQGALLGPLNIAITLVVIVFGIMIATGMSPLTTKEAALFLFKIALVWGFAANAQLGIGIGYRFFMGVAQEGSDIVLKAICGGSGYTPTLTQPDSLISSFASLLDSGAAFVSPTQGCLDDSITWPVINTACGNYFMIAMAIMLFVSPSAISFIGILVIEYLTLYVRALVGYLAALVFITFLFILSPLFISFALFRSTFHLFTKWLQFLTSFSLQMVLIFAFLAMITAVSGHLIATFFQFMALFQPYDITLGSYQTHMPMTVCSICEGSLSSGSATGAMPTFQCGGSGAANDGVPGSSGQVIPLTSIYLHQDLVAFIVAQAVAWWLIAYVLGEFMQKAPDLARKLAGAPMSGGLGGMPVIKSSGGAAPGIQYPGLDAMKNAAEGAVTGAADKIRSMPIVQRALLGAGVGGLAAGANTLWNKNRGGNASAEMGSAGADIPMSGVQTANAGTNIPTIGVQAGDAVTTNIVSGLDSLGNKVGKAAGSAAAKIARNAAGLGVAKVEGAFRKDPVAGTGAESTGTGSAPSASGGGSASAATKNKQGKGSAKNPLLPGGADVPDKVQQASLMTEARKGVRLLKDKLRGYPADSEQAKKIQTAILQAESGMLTADNATALASILENIAAAEKIV